MWEATCGTRERESLTPQVTQVRNQTLVSRSHAQHTATADGRPGFEKKRKKARRSQAAYSGMRLKNVAMKTITTSIITITTR